MVNEYNAEIKEIKNLTETVREFTLSLDDDLVYKPGQFVILSDILNGRVTNRAYSISSYDENFREIKLCIKRVENGLFTNHLWKKIEGDKLKLKGPFGFFGLDKVKTKNILFIAVGTGIAPIKSMIDYLIKKESDNFENFTLLFGERYEDEILYEEEFREYEKKNSKFKFIPVISRPRDINCKYKIGHVQDVLKNLDLKKNDTSFLICGMKNMVDDVVNIIKEKGFTDEFIQFEKF